MENTLCGSFAGAALVLIDVQAGFDEAYWGPRNNPYAERNIARLLEAWRSTGRRILHVRHDSQDPASPLRVGQPGNAPKPEARELPGERVYRKNVNSAFIGTTLEQDLRRDGIDTLIFVGFSTNFCVATSVRMSGNLGFDTYVVSDATATFDLVGFDGRLLTAEVRQHAALSDLHGEFATVVDTLALLSAVGRPISRNEMLSGYTADRIGPGTSSADTSSPDTSSADTIGTDTTGVSRSAAS